MQAEKRVLIEIPFIVNREQRYSNTMAKERTVTFHSN